MKKIKVSIVKELMEYEQSREMLDLWWEFCLNNNTNKLVTVLEIYLKHYPFTSDVYADTINGEKVLVIETTTRVYHFPIYEDFMSSWILSGYIVSDKVIETKEIQDYQDYIEHLDEYGLPSPNNQLTIDSSLYIER